MLFVCHPKILHKHCLQFLLEVKMAPRETLVTPSLFFKARLSDCKGLDIKMIFNSHAMKLIFTWKVLHLASFWKWEFLELKNGLSLLIQNIFPFLID